MVCSVGMTGVVQRQQGGLKEARFPEIKEPVPHLRFGEKIMPLPQPVLKDNLLVDIEFHKKKGLRLPATKRIRSVPIKLTADSGAEGTACNVDLNCHCLALEGRTFSPRLSDKSVLTRKMRMF